MDDIEDDNDSADGVFKEQNSIQICCIRGDSLADGIFNLYIDKNGSNEWSKMEFVVL